MLDLQDIKQEIKILKAYQIDKKFLYEHDIRLMTFAAIQALKWAVETHPSSPHEIIDEMVDTVARLYPNDNRGVDNKD